MAKAKKKAPAKKAVAKKTIAKKPAGKKAAPKKIQIAKPKNKPSPKSTGQIVDLSQFVTPLDDRLIVQLTVKEPITAGGIIIPDTVTDVSGHKEGVVAAVGRGHRDPKGRLRPMDVKRGDKVVFASFSGSKIQYENLELIILRETDVMGVIS